MAAQDCAQPFVLLGYRAMHASSGLDPQFLGWMLITFLYGSWEDKYREKLAIKLGCEKRHLQDDLFGDLGQLRNAIVHNNGVATREVENAKILKWFRRGDSIFISYDHADFLLDRIDTFVTNLCRTKAPIANPPKA